MVERNDKWTTTQHTSLIRSTRHTSITNTRAKTRLIHYTNVVTQYPILDRTKLEIMLLNLAKQEWNQDKHESKQSTPYPKNREIQITNNTINYQSTLNIIQSTK